MDIRPKVLVTKIGLDGHDRGSRLVAAYLRDAGMEVIYTPPWQEIPAVVKLATEEDVDVIGISSLATDHLIVPKLMAALRAAGLSDIAVVVGGIVPDDDEEVLLEAGVARVFHPGRRARGDRRLHPRHHAGASRAGAIARMRSMRMNKPLDHRQLEPAPARTAGSRSTPRRSAPTGAVRNRSGIADQAAVHAARLERRAARRRRRVSGPAAATRAASTRRCTAAGRGRNAS